MADFRNYLPAENPFHLAGPPEWFLRRLYEYDPSLVVVPSRQEAVYRLCQRRKLDLASKFTQDMMFQQSDTRLLASYGLVPVTSFLATVNWSSPQIFQELTRRAPWRMGGAEKFEGLLNEQDKRRDLAAAHENEAMLEDLGKDAWGLYLKKVGLRTSMWVPRTAVTPSPLLSPFIKKEKPRVEVSSTFTGR